MSAMDNDNLVREFVEAFNTKDAEKVGTFLHPDVVFENYGETPVKGRDNVVQVWEGVFRTFAQVKFETVNQAVNDDVVLAEQVHGLALPGGKLAPIMNLAVYEIRDGKIAAWRDYGNPQYAMKLLQS
ncbi:nuclear transport factor 2 family protein [Micromonospora sp. WMMD1155]|uniref:nuclear transport factor 2 family protein n=1 Tax=Micromonospora sp. WMMD1155 TaxID=3016094 RepID=UPI00249BBCCA|nr:nuclear transport factor 2 family protein [Micromonospora sp. WMMD1155]WFE49766.1 nuclear transport factor 2 family protein [Micromonospora sp. WMMD1155]